ncbi:uncharacterized protein LOC128385570 isoform X2 [Panonychus citri]|uniref:uncharacterized protein LOC128385570 isoform X2 n=1 Tax=Panonychus citri TaxID=50023 RepID=UPI0023078E38|nr:uncharacterized protein LOC128385570 isoform X2 [Panonychus citri]
MQIFVKNLAEREKRTDSLIKRIKRIQWRQLESHTTEELESFYERQSKLVSTLDPPKPLPHKLTSSTNPPTIQTGDQIKSSTDSPVNNILDPSLINQNSGLPTSYNSNNNNNPTTSSTTTPKDEPTIPDEQLTSTKPKSEGDVKQSKKSNSGSSTANAPPVVNQLFNNFTPSILDCAEDELLRSAVGIITANLKLLEYSYDSDATESSSGGESCDEFENVFSDNFSRTNTSSNILEPIERKANWRWLNERSAIASRWTWLQAQVADLEFKIRQQNEMYRQLRASKGSIAFYCKEAPTNNSIPNSLTKSSLTATPRATPSSSSIWTQQPTCSTSLPMNTSPSTTTPKTPLLSKPCIQIPPITLSTPPSTPNLDSLENTSSTTTTTTTTTSTTTTDSLSIDVSSFKFAKNTPSSNYNSNNNNNNSGKLTNMLGSNNGTLNTQGNLSSSSGPNSNGLSDYSLPSVNSDSTISLSPPLENLAASSSRTNSPQPSSSNRLSSFESSLQESTTTTSTTTSTTTTTTTTTTSTFSSSPSITTTTSTPTIRSSCNSTSTPPITTTTTTSATGTTPSIAPQKQPGGLNKDCTTPCGEEKHDITLNSEKEIHHCARTLPLKQMRKRKLVRSCNAITASRKIARYSTVQCSCSNYPKFVSPCVLCNGRFSHLQMVDTDCMPNYERYALLDPSYHPVLSLPTDVALGLYFSKILKKDTTAVQKPLKSRITGTTIATSTSSTLSALSSTSAPQPTKTKSTNKRSTHSEFPFKFGQDNKKTQLNRGKSQAIISSTKLKKKYDGTTKKKYAKKNNNLRKRNFRVKNDQTHGEFPSPLSSENSHTPIHRRRRSEQYAYDINNIVIPYSIASTTRVEKLQYKEIITPKWRFVESDNNTNDNNNSSSNNNNDSKEMQESINDGKQIQQQTLDNSSEKNNIFKFDQAEETDEDISDEAFAIRHAKCEIDERRQRNLHLHQKSSSATTTKNHHNHPHPHPSPQSPSTEIMSSSPSLTQNSHTQPFQ